MKYPLGLLLLSTVMGLCSGCHHGVKGTLVIKNGTGRGLYCLWTIAPAESLRSMPVSPGEDSLHLDLLKDGEEQTVLLPSGVSGTDRITIRMYSLDSTTMPHRYRLESLTMTTVQHLDADDWRPVVIKKITMESGGE